MKMFIIINPITNKPTQFSFSSENTVKFGETFINDSGVTEVRLVEPIILEINKHDPALLDKVYNPKTKKLEDE